MASVSSVLRVVGLGAALLGALPRPLPAERADAPNACTTYTADYLLAARLRLEDTPFGAADGLYEIGPGRLRLRFSPSRVELLAYEMRDRFTAESHVLFFRAKVVTRTETRATPAASGVAAVGALSGRTLTWSTPVRGYRTDGTLNCEGSGCGLPGAPSSGTTALHIGPGPVVFGRFSFHADGLETFQMDFTRVSHTDTPKQTAFVSIAGRRVSRECVPAGVAPGG